MKNKVCFIGDICIRISTYRNPKINGKELKDFINFADFIAENTDKLEDNYLYFLQEEVTYATDVLNADQRLSINFEGLYDAAWNLECELSREITEREEENA